MTIPDIRNKKVVIMGLGQNEGGVGSARFFAEHGARVLVTDLKSAKELRASLAQLRKFRITYVLGRHRKKDFQIADLIIKNPAVPPTSPYLKIAKQSRVKIDSDIGIFFSLCNVPIIGITGTKGKTTTATLTAAILKEQYRHVVLAGNLQISVLQALKKIKQDSRVVLELSSFGLEGLMQHKKSPRIACITNFFPDHLNRYATLHDYLRAKEIIFRFQSSTDFVVLNYTSAHLRKAALRAKSRVVWFAGGPKNSSRVFLSKDRIIANGGFTEKFNFSNKLICSLKDIHLQGTHNIENVMAAVAIALLEGVAPGHIKKALRKFGGVPNRMQLIGVYKGVSYINDTTSTIPESTCASLAASPKKVILISGGASKGLDIENLVSVIVASVKALILLPGSATHDLSKRIQERVKRQKRKFPMIQVSNMKEAVRSAAQSAKKGDIVLLSPGFASFGLFQNEFHRGREFQSHIKRLYGKT